MAVVPWIPGTTTVNPRTGSPGLRGFGSGAVTVRDHTEDIKNKPTVRWGDTIRIICPFDMNHGPIKIMAINAANI